MVRLSRSVLSRRRHPRRHRSVPACLALFSPPARQPPPAPHSDFRFQGLAGRRRVVLRYSYGTVRTAVLSSTVLVCRRAAVRYGMVWYCRLYI